MEYNVSNKSVVLYVSISTFPFKFVSFWDLVFFALLVFHSFIHEKHKGFCLRVIYTQKLCDIHFTRKTMATICLTMLQLLKILLQTVFIRL